MINQEELKDMVISAVCDVNNNDLTLLKKLDALRSIIQEDRMEGKEVTNEDADLVRNVLNIIKENIANCDFSVDDLSAKMNMHRTTLYRRLTQACNNAPIRLIRKARMEKAYYLLVQGDWNVSQVAYLVGYHCPKNFTHHFIEHFGFYPHEVLKKMKAKK